MFRGFPFSVPSGQNVSPGGFSSLHTPSSAPFQHGFAFDHTTGRTGNDGRPAVPTTTQYAQHSNVAAPTQKPYDQSERASKEFLEFLATKERQALSNREDFHRRDSDSLHHGGGTYYNAALSPNSSRGHKRSKSRARSRSPCGGRSRSRAKSHGRRKSRARSRSPGGGWSHSRAKSRGRSKSRARSRSPGGGWSHSRAKSRGRSKSRARSRSPGGGRSHSRAKSCGRSKSRGEPSCSRIIASSNPSEPELALQKSAKDPLRDTGHLLPTGTKSIEPLSICPPILGETWCDPKNKNQNLLDGSAVRQYKEILSRIKQEKQAERLLPHETHWRGRNVLLSMEDEESFLYGDEKNKASEAQQQNVFVSTVKSKCESAASVEASSPTSVGQRAPNRFSCAPVAGLQESKKPPVVGEHAKVQNLLKKIGLDLDFTSINKIVSKIQEKNQPPSRSHHSHAEHGSSAATSVWCSGSTAVTSDIPFLGDTSADLWLPPHAAQNVSQRAAEGQSRSAQEPQMVEEFGARDVKYAISADDSNTQQQKVIMEEELLKKVGQIEKKMESLAMEMKKLLKQQGFDFLIPVSGYYCQFCEEFLGDLPAAQEHAACRHKDNTKKRSDKPSACDSGRNQDALVNFELKRKNKQEPNKPGDPRESVTGVMEETTERPKEKKAKKEKKKEKKKKKKSKKKKHE